MALTEVHHDMRDDGEIATALPIGKGQVRVRAGEVYILLNRDQATYLAAALNDSVNIDRK